MGAFNRTSIVEEVSRAAEIPLRESAAIVELMLDSMVRAIRAGDKVELRGFGSFGTRSRGPSVRRNPKTDASVKVPAKRIPFFKPSRELKDLINRS
jgi:integration host factor subunit beta